MTIPVIKIKVFPKAVVKGKLDVRFPADVVGENFIVITRANGGYTVDVNYSLLTPGPVLDPATAFIAVQDQTADVYKTVSLASLLTSGLDADLQAIAALTGTGIVRRTGTNTWTAGTAVANSELATMAAYTLKGNATGSTATPTDIDITALTAKASPVSADIVLIQDSAASNAFKKTTVGALAGAAGVASYNGLTGAVAGFTADKVYFVSTAGNDSNNGLSPESAKLTLQAAVNAANPNGTVYVGVGSFAGAVLMQPGVQIIGSPGTIITQANSANLTTLIDFQTNSAHGAAIRGCQIDGNRANNTDDDTKTLVLIGTANDVALEYNKFRNMGGSCVIVTNGLRPIVCRNDFQNVMTLALGATPTPSAIVTNGRFNDNTFSNNLGQHVIYIAKSNGNVIKGNRIEATQLIGVCNVSGHTVTWVSGTNFSGLLPGGFCIMSPGGSFTEGYITAVNSSTVLTVRETLAATNGVAFVIGTGDLINIGNSGQNKVSGNLIRRGSSGGIVLHNFYGGQYLIENVVEENEVYYTGGSGISVQSTATTPTTFASDTTIQNNRIVSCGMGGAAVGALGKCAVGIIDFAPTTLGSCVISGNRFQNEGGLSTMDWGVYCSGVSAGQVFAGNNTCISISNPGIRNGIASVTLSAGWGSAAAVSVIRTTGDSFQFVIVPSGTGIAANPTISVSTVATSLTQPPQPQCKLYNLNGAAFMVMGDVDQSPSASSMFLTCIGTPVSGLAHYFGCNG